MSIYLRYFYRRYKKIYNYTFYIFYELTVLVLTSSIALQNFFRFYFYHLPLSIFLAQTHTLTDNVGFTYGLRHRPTWKYLVNISIFLALLPQCIVTASHNISWRLCRPTLNSDHVVLLKTMVLL